MSDHKRKSLAFLSLLALVVVGCGQPEPGVGIEIPGSLRLAELSDDERARLQVTLTIEGVLDETALTLSDDAREASGEITLPNVTSARTAPFSLELRLRPADDVPGDPVLLARALGEIELEPHARNELSLADDAFDVCGATQPGAPCSLLFDRNRNGAPNLEDLLGDIEPLPPAPFVDAAPDTLQFPSGIRLGTFARQVIVIENASASEVEVKASLVGAPGVTLSRYETVIDAADGARRAIDLGVVQPFQEAFLAVSFAPVNPYLTTGAVFIEAFDPRTRVRQATRVKVIANADGELQPPTPGFEIGDIAEGADLGGYLGDVQPFPTAELFNGLAVTGVASEDVVTNGLPYTGRKIRAVFDAERGPEELPADAVFLVEVPPKNRLSVALAGLARDVDLGVLVLDEDDGVQDDAEKNFRPVQSGSSPEALELRNESSDPLRALVVLGRVETFPPPEAAPNALSESEPTSFDMQTTVSSAPEFTEPLSPITGPIEGGNRVLLTGRGFHPSATVTFADAVALDCSHAELPDGTTTLTCTTPPGSLLVGKNPATIVVANPSADEGGDGQAATYPEGYTYQPPAPRLDDMSPRVAPTTGSTGAITLLGAFFSTRHGTPRVLFGQQEAQSVTFIDAGRLEVVAPAQAAGVVSVTVQNVVGGTDDLGNPLYSLKSNSRSFTYIQSAGPPPQLFGIDPATGSVDGGDTVTLSGLDFGLDAQVTFDAVPSGSVTYVSAESLSVKVPARTAPGVVDVEVVNADGQTSKLPGAYTYFIPSPTVSNAFPAEASTTGGTFIVVSGTSFRAGVQVLFTSPDGTPISSPNVNRVSTGTLLVATPAVQEGGDYGIQVINVDGQSASYGGTFRYLEPAGPAPRIDTIDPPSGFKEQPNLVTLTGSDFRGPPAILVGSDTAEVATFTDNEVPEKDVITFYTPVVAQEGPVVVRLINSDGQSDTSVFTYFTDLDAPPQIFQVTPAQGKAGDVVIIRGSGFDADDVTQTLGEGAQLLVRGGSVQPTSATTSEIVFPLPAVQTTSPLAIELTIVNGDGQRSSGSFLYVPPSAPAPSISQVTPASGPVGTNVVVTGSDFNVTQVRVGTQSVSSSSYTASATQVSFAIPSALLPSQALIRLTNADGQVATAPFTVTAVVTPQAPPPAIHSMTPVEVPPAGGTQVTVTGQGFSTGAKLFLAGTELTGASFSSTTTVTFTAPAKVEGSYTVSVVNADGQAAHTSLRYKAPTSATGTPVVGIVIPEQVHAFTPGDAITVTGQNLAGVTSASIARSTGGTALGTVTITSKTDAAVTVQNSLGLERSDQPSTGTPYVLRLTGTNISLTSPPFQARAPNIIYFDAENDGDLFFFGEMLNPTKLTGALFTDTSGKNASVPLVIGGKSETFLFASTGGVRMLPGAPYTLTLSYTGVAAPVVPFAPGAPAPSFGPDPLDLMLHRPRVPASSALSGFVRQGFVERLHEYSDAELGAPSTWTFSVTPLQGGSPLASGTWSRDPSGDQVWLSFTSGTLPLGDYLVTLATEKTPQLGVTWQQVLSAALPSLTELQPSLVNEGGSFGVGGDLFAGNRIVAVPSAGGTAVELLVVPPEYDGGGGGGGPDDPAGGDGGPTTLLTVPTTGLLPGNYDVCAVASGAPLACSSGSLPLEIQPHPCGDDVIAVGTGGRFTLALDRDVSEHGCGMGLGKGLTFELPVPTEVRVRFVASDASQISIAFGQNLCSGGSGQCVPPEEEFNAILQGSYQLFFIDMQASGTTSLTVDVTLSVAGECLRSDDDADGYDICSGDCAEADASVHPGASESCNGVDDDCDGVIDNLGPCTVSGQLGVCAQGELQCDGGGAAVCQQVSFAGTEVCADSADNNCDGTVDEATCVAPGASSIPYAPEVGPFVSAIPIPIGGDTHVSAPIEIGFPFTYFGEPVTHLSLDLDGRLLFGGSGSLTFGHPSFPYPDDNNAFIAFAWTDLHSTRVTSALYEVRGTAPDRVLIIDVRGVDYFADPRHLVPSVNAQILLKENGSFVEVHTDRLRGTNQQAVTQGFESWCGNLGATLSPQRISTSFGLDGDGVRLVPYGPTCGNCRCETGEEQSCPTDCGDAATAGGGAICGNSRCETYESQSCPGDCGAGVCGNGRCDGAETSTSCLVDCGPDVCGNGACDTTAPVDERLYCVQDCPTDYDNDGDGDPQSVEDVQVTSDNNADQDGDLLLDGQDPDFNDPDFDNDGELDGSEVLRGLDPNSPTQFLTGCSNGVCDGSEDHTICPADCWCGNYVCDTGETLDTCPSDCGGTGGGEIVCGDAICEGTEPETCPTDCGAQGPCGDAICDPAAGEDEFNCPSDCGGAASCGDAICDPAAGEDEFNCPSDCGAQGSCGDAICDPAVGEDQFNCPSDCPNTCGDAICDPAAGEDDVTCPSDCGGAASCGDAICDAAAGEDEFNCPSDCPSSGGVCGDAICDTGEIDTCPTDCPP